MKREKNFQVQVDALCLVQYITTAAVNHFQPIWYNVKVKEDAKKINLTLGKCVKILRFSLFYLYT